MTVTSKIPGLKRSVRVQPKIGSSPASIIVRRAPRSNTQGILAFGSLRFPCALGRSGISALKREGDGATPLAEMTIIGGYFNASRGTPYPTQVPMRAARKSDGWCDAPHDANYNTPVDLPFSASHETLTRDDRLYDIILVLDWNITNRARYRGSAIFMHIAKPGYEPTEGCIALNPRHMAQLMRILKPGMRVKVVR